MAGGEPIRSDISMLRRRSWQLVLYCKHLRLRNVYNTFEVCIEHYGSSHAKGYRMPVMVVSVASTRSNRGNSRVVQY